MLKRLPEDQHNRHRMVHCLGSASDAKIASLNADLSAACQHCGDPDGSITHKCWRCPALDHVRFHEADHLRAIKPEHCPTDLVLGIPGDYVALPDPNFCQPLCHDKGAVFDNLGVTYEKNRQLANERFATNQFALLHANG